MNLGFKCAQGKYICMISDDCLIIPGAIINGYNLFEEELAKGNNVGAVAFYWRNWPEDTNFYVKCTIKDKMMVNHGIFLSQVLKEIDYIEENLYIFYCADGDLSLKIWNNGYNIIASKKSLIEHYSHANTGVRKQNSSFYKSDLAAKINRWNGVFYPNGTNLTGNDLELDYPYISDIGRNNFFWTYILHDKAQMILYKILDLIKDGCRIIAFKYLK